MSKFSLFVALLAGVVLATAACSSVPATQPAPAPAEPPTAESVAPAERISAHDEPAPTETAPPAPTPAPTPSPSPSPTIETAAEEMPPLDNGPSQAQLKLLAGLKSQGPAPALVSDTWLNTEPLAWDDLRGKVVIIEFWTFG